MATPLPELVTGEAVALDLRPASFATRGLAFGLDGVLQIGLLLGALWFSPFVVGGLDDAAAAAGAIALVVGVLVALPVAVETLTRGRSLGKLALGLRVVRDDGGPVRLRHALVRWLVGFGEIWLTFGSPAVITSLVSPQGKRIGDLVAGTYVVRDRAGGPRPAPVLMPRELEGWIATADIGRVPDQLAMSVRQYLGRAARLHPASRDRLAGTLAHEVLRFVAPAPPPGTPPERLLAAVLAERRDRELQRLRRQRKRRDAQAERLHRLPFDLDA